MPISSGASLHFRREVRVLEIDDITIVEVVTEVKFSMKDGRVLGARCSIISKAVVRWYFWVDGRVSRGPL